MDRAVVPVDGLSVGLNDEVWLKCATSAGKAFIDGEGGKLTKEDIETLVRVYEEFRPDTWRDKSECMVLAVTSIGLEVED
jgi:hypothetical protein